MTSVPFRFKEILRKGKQFTLIEDVNGALSHAKEIIYLFME